MIQSEKFTARKNDTSLNTQTLEGYKDYIELKNQRSREACNVVTITQIKAQINRVNSGEDADADYANLRRLQKAFASAVAKTGELCIPPSTIRHLNAKDFPQGITLRSRKYRINCNREKTTVWHVETFKDLYIHQMPFYIREFLGV